MEIHTSPNEHHPAAVGGIDTLDIDALFFGDDDAGTVVQVPTYTVAVEINGHLQLVRGLVAFDAFNLLVTNEVSYKVEKTNVGDIECYALFCLEQFGSSSRYVTVGFSLADDEDTAWPDFTQSYIQKAIEQGNCIEDGIFTTSLARAPS